MRKITVFVLISLLAIAGCSNYQKEDQPEISDSIGPLSISDAVHNGGNEHFYWLPPLVKAPNPTGNFVDSLSPIVKITPYPPDDIIFTMTTGPGSKTVRVVPEDEHYIVNWHTKEYDLVSGQIYRIHVLVDGDVLGHADVEVVSSGNQLKTVNTDEYFALKDGRTLPIKFRIEEGALNNPPIAYDSEITTPEDTPRNFTLSADDPDNDPLTYHIDIPPEFGELLQTNGASFTYTPQANYFGSDSFSFYVNDGQYDSNVAFVSIEVGPVNDPPVAFDQSVTTDEDNPIPITLEASDPDIDTLDYSIVTLPARGVLEPANGDGAQRMYIPNLNFFGSDNFTFRVKDGFDYSNIATINIEVLPVNDSPIAYDQDVVTDEDTSVDIELKASDIENDHLTYHIDVQPQYGNLVWVDDEDGPDWRYTPDTGYMGSDSFTFYVNDGSEDSNSATVNIVIGPKPSLDAFVVNTNDQANKIWLNDGSGTFIDSGQSLGASASYDVALGDLDGDGDLDAFVANNVGNYSGGYGQSQPEKVWLNNGSGTFIDSGQSLGVPGFDMSYGVALGDLDGDNDLDAFVVNTGASMVWLNNGTGTYSHGWQEPFAYSSPHGVALGDLDGDGDLDAFVANNNQPNRVWLNNGSGTFISSQSMGAAQSLGVAISDLDGDGDLDAFVSNFNQPNRVWLNNGSGTFIDSGQSLGGSRSYGVALGDMDDDGDLDAFVANDGVNRVWLNNGNGTFISGQSLGSSSSARVALGDLDRDGDLDAFVSNFNQPNKVWLNNGNGTFIDSGQSLGVSRSWGVALGDLDGR